MNCEKCGLKKEVKIGVMLLRNKDVYSADASVCSCGDVKISGIGANPYMDVNSPQFEEIKEKFKSMDMFFKEEISYGACND